MANLANIERLNSAIDALNNDAESLHELITRSTDELAKAIKAGDRATGNAEKVIYALEPLTEKMEARIDGAESLVESAKAASAEQQRVTAENLEILHSSANSAINEFKAKIQEEYDSLNKNQSALADKLDDSISTFANKQSMKFDEFATKYLLESEKTRDTLQTDLLANKNATNARLENLESQITKLANTIEETSQKSVSIIGSIQKKLSVAVYAAVAVGIANLACLIFLLVR